MTIYIVAAYNEDKSDYSHIVEVFDDVKKAENAVKEEEKYDCEILECQMDAWPNYKIETLNK